MHYVIQQMCKRLQRDVVKGDRYMGEGRTIEGEGGRVEKVITAATNTASVVEIGLRINAPRRSTVNRLYDRKTPESGHFIVTCSYA